MMHHLTDAGVCGPAMSKPIPLAFIHASAQNTIDVLDLAYLAGHRDATAVAARIMQDALSDGLTAKVEAGEKHLDDLAMDRIAENAGITPHRGVLPPKDNSQPWHTNQDLPVARLGPGGDHVRDWPTPEGGEPAGRST